MPRFAYLAIALLPGVLSHANTTVTCTVDSINWTFNSLGVSPCWVAADLAGVCQNGVFSLKPIDSGYVYIISPHDSCQCNSVFYSLESACAACQGRGWLGWDEYVAKCNATYLGDFPMPIPAGTRVPGWAYADVNVASTFNLTVAESLDLRPESIGTTSSTSSSTLPTRSTSFGFSTTSLAASSTSPTSSTPSSTSPTSGQSGSSPGSNAGAITGGVIGGVFGLALIGGIIFCFLHRRRQHSGHQPPYSAFNTIPYIAAPHNPDRNMSYNPPVNPFTPVTSAHQTLYDPSYPSTFPSSAPGPGPFYTSTFLPLPQARTHPPFQGLDTQVGQHSPQISVTGLTDLEGLTLASDTHAWPSSSGSLYRGA